MSPSVFNFNCCCCVLILSVVQSACTTPAQVPADTSHSKNVRKPSAGEFRIAPPPASTEGEQQTRRETVEKVLAGDRSPALDEVRLPASVMGLEPGDVTGDPIALSRDRRKLQRTDAEIASVSGAGEFEKKLGDFDRVLGVTEEEDRPASPSFTASTKKIRELFQQKKYEDALVETNELLLHYAKSSLLWTMKGTLHLRLSQSDLSLSAYEKAFDLEPSPRLLAQIEQLRRIVAERESMRLKKQTVKPEPQNPEEGRAP